MQVNSMESVQAISKYLAFLSDYTSILNGIGDFSINKYAETALIDMLDIMFQTKFRNSNFTQKNNPCIDLISDKKRIGIQITATNKINKIKDCIEKYFRHAIYKNVNELIVFTTSIRDINYNQITLNKFVETCYSKYNVPKEKRNFIFNLKKQLLDKPAIIQLLHETDTTSLKRIELALKKQFDTLKTSEDLIKYYDSLKEKYYDVVLNDEKGMTLKDIYVEPMMAMHHSNLTDKKIAIEDYKDFWELKKPVSIHHYFNEFFLNNKEYPGIQPSRIALILGSPGQGKTSFCRKLLYDFILSGQTTDRDIFYIKLKDVPNSKDLINSPLTVLIEEIKVITGENITNTTFRRAIVILDGLDELYMKDGLKLDDIETLCKELIREIQREESSDMHLIITSRLGYVDIEKFYREKISLIQLTPLNEKLQIQWIEKYLRFHPQAWLNIEKIKTYNKNKNEYEYLKELLEQPLLLHMMATLKKEVTEDVTRFKIYDQLFTELIERKYSPDGQIQILKEIQTLDLRKLIREIAFSIHQQGNGFISKKELLALPPIQKFLRKFPTSDFKENLKGVMISFYFRERRQDSQVSINENTEYAIEFIHKSLGEFMVVEKIFNDLIFKFGTIQSDGDYLIEDSIEALKQLNYLFSKPVNGIREHLLEMINSLEKNVKELLSNRLAIFLNDFVTYDFISAYDASKQKDPLELASTTFFGTWLFMKAISKRNYLANKITRQKVINYFSAYGNLFPSLCFADASYQDFSNTQITHVWYWDWIISANFQYTQLGNSGFVDIEINSTTFNKSELYQIGFYDCYLLNSSFANTYLSDLEFHNVTIENVDFSYSSISGLRIKNVKFKKMKAKHFYGITIGIDDLILLLQNGAKIDLAKIKVEKGYKTFMGFDELVEIMRGRMPNYRLL